MSLKKKPSTKELTSSFNEPTNFKHLRKSKKVARVAKIATKKVTTKTKLATKKAVIKTKSASKKVVIKTKSGTKKVAKVTYAGAKFAGGKTKKVAKSTHRVVAVKPHNYLTQKFPRYQKWHEWRWHRSVHYSILAVYLVVIGSMIFASTKFVFAADITDNWNFSNPADFSFDNQKVEPDSNDNSIRLKAQNYNNDVNTSVLLHFDETSGTTASDSSSNSNNATLEGAPSFVGGNLNNGLSLNGNTQFGKIADSPSLTLGGTQTIEGWTKFNNNFDTNASQDQGIVDKGSYKLYYDRSTGKINYEIANNNANSWTKQAGGDVNGSWGRNGKQIVRSTVIKGSDVYVGLGLGVGDAEVWKWNGTTWAKIGGDGVNSGWADQEFEDVFNLVIDGNTLYASLGSTAGDAEIWSCDLVSNCNDWTKIGGDGINSGWAVNTYEYVMSMHFFGGNLYAGLGSTANDAEVWRWNGSSWTKIGGDSLNSGWTTNFETVGVLMNDGTNLYAGLGDTAQDAEVWRWNGSNWTKIGGDGLNSSWSTANNIEQVKSMTYFGGNLYVGTANTAGDADVWMWNGSVWSHIGGDGLNSGWASGTYEGVYAIANDGTNLYAGTAISDGDGEVWKWNGSNWTKIGGDGINGSFSSNYGDGIFALEYSGGKLYTGLYDAGGGASLWTYDGSTWEWIGGGYVNKSWGGYGLQSVESTTTHKGKLYAGTGVSIAGNALVWEFDGSSWNLIGGQGINGSWAPDIYENVFNLQSYRGNLYAGLGTSANDAEVWMYNGSVWSKVGGDGVNSSWGANYEAVNVLAVWGDDLYAGLGTSANDAEVWKYDGSTWSKVGGDSLNSSWGANYESVISITVFQGNLYAGLGTSANDAEVWKYDGSTWSKVGGDSLNSSWGANYEEVYIMRVFDNKLTVGLGNSTGDGEIWQYDGTNWSQIGGDNINNSWADGTYEKVYSMAIYNGRLYAGIGYTAGDGEVWEWDGTNWSQIGGDSLNSSWTNTVEYVSTLIDYKGKLFAGTGFSTNMDANMYSWGNNGFLSSNQSSQDTNWHHIGATYDGTNMKIYIDGTEDASATTSVTIPDNNIPLLVGSTYGSSSRGETQGYFNGAIDELRLSNISRSSFTSKPYTSDPQTVTLNDAVRKSGVLAWDTFSGTEVPNGGTINYRLSDDEGVTWKYWDGSAWAVSGSVSQANPISVINSNIASFPVTFSGIKWQAILDGDGTQRVTLNDVQLGFNQDMVAPSANASSIIAKKSNGGDNINSGSWTNSSSPYFSWTAGTDGGSGIKGYCLYLGTDINGDPVTTKGLLGTSPDNSGGNCQFMVSAVNIDLSTPGLIATPLSSSNSYYYLNIKAIDNAGNIFGSNAQFTFRFDNTKPENPGFISAPGGFINTKTATLTWPTSGGQEASDANSGLAGLQYKINSSSWYGDSHTGLGDINDLLANDGNYTTQDPPDFSNLNEGVNTIYFRTWDNAGNVTNTFVSAALKVNTSGAPSEPLNLTVNPSTNSTNSFSFDWDPPATYVGDVNNLTYCYTVNTLPTSSNCSFTSGGVTSLGAGPFATQPGANTFYVVAKDESSNINYASYSSIIFSANTPSPGMPLNTDIVDVSIKSTSNWRLALTWEVPSNVGAGIASYKVYRSTDNSTFSFVGSSSSTTYIDASLSQQVYYYKVNACDSTNNCGSSGTVVSLTPTGKFTSPAVITSEPSASSITTKKAKITWTTDRGSDSKIAIGTSSGRYSPSEVGNSDQVTAHELNLDNLAAGTTYYYVAKWTDEDGNTGESQEYTFTTSPAPTLKEITTTATALSSATIEFRSVEAVKVNIYYGLSESFGGVKSTNTSLAESAYSFNLSGLTDGSKYFYKLSAFDEEGNEYSGSIFSFTTPPRPKISNLRFQPVQGEPTSTQQVSWETNVPTSSQLTYGLTNSAGIEKTESELKTAHQMTIKGLQDDSEYYLIAQGRDKDGNLSTSDKQVFRTALDTRPPNVKNIAVEVSIKGTGAEARGQVVVSWNTDEPASSQVGYAEGSDVEEFNNKSALDDTLTTEHLVIVSDLPTSKLYSIVPLSKDKAGNEGKGETQSAIVGKASDSVLTIILSTLQKIFGF